MTEAVKAALDYVEQMVEADIPTKTPEMKAALLTLAGAVIQLTADQEETERVLSEALARMSTELEEV